MEAEGVVGGDAEDAMLPRSAAVPLAALLLHSSLLLELQALRLDWDVNVSW